VNKPTCNVPGCDARTYRHGVCAEHHAQNYRQACAVENCDDDVFAKDLCDAHYTVERRAKEKGEKPKFQRVREYRVARKVGKERMTKIALTRLEAWVIEDLIAASGKPRRKTSGRQVSGLYSQLGAVATQWAIERRKALGLPLPATLEAA
jgi:hypothetical protein